MTKPIVTDEMVDAAWREFGSCTIANKKHARAYLEAALAVQPGPKLTATEKDYLMTRLVLAPGEPQPDAPTDIALLPDYWDERRRRQGKPDLSRCAAELRIALRAKGGERE